MINLSVLFYYTLDGPVAVRINLFLRSISKIDDIAMVSKAWQLKN